MYIVQPLQQRNRKSKSFRRTRSSVLNLISLFVATSIALVNTYRLSAHGLKNPRQ